MKHISVKSDAPCEVINVTPINPLISKCEIKVCYVGEEPNRNGSIITKDVAREMANSLPGSPIVGFYNKSDEDFEEHNRMIDLSNGKFDIIDTTRPYGFVDLNAKVWFQKFVDDNTTEHEYLMTEGYLWTGQYEEANRIIEQGNNQSMELENIDGTWSEDSNGYPEFFIINEAVISKLCILGENCEPCFEGSTITAPKFEFSLDEDFKEKLFSMMNEVKELMKEGGTPVFNTFAVEIGDDLWNALYSYLESNFPRDLRDGESADCYRCSKYYLESIWEESSQKFAILRDRTNGKIFRMNFSWSDDGFSADNNLIEVEKTYVPVSETPVFALEEVEKFENERYSLKDKNNEGNQNNSNNTTEDNDPVTYSLEEIPEYVELLNNYNELKNNYSALEDEKNNLNAQLTPLLEFKANAERKEKQDMIDSFYMLSDEDKSDVITNIDTYSLDDIEAKLSIICVRNKVNFNLDEEDNNNQNPTTYSLTNEQDNDDAPAWIKSLCDVAKEME